ncbi:radical SAM protein [uncultured Tateyamaria sp.]|uniref:B12-binding domain-containing radical SAM protein n=1 Tax=uncultured Tateyamaria sp. TaxID=455651 RepID=UPI0026264920|nr:radical SAM protein [uncultured Tateyamaria sp.]
MNSLDLVLVNYIHRSDDGKISQSPQLGLVYLATSAVQAGFGVKILAGDNVSNDLGSEVKKSKNLLIGFYSNSDNYSNILKLAELCKRIDPDCLVVLGGPLASVIDEEMLSNDCIDFVARGDGEELIVELLNAIKHGGDFSSIHGLSFKAADAEATGSVFVRNLPRRRLRDLDEIPIPDRSLYPTKEFGIRSFIVSSRGCGYRCTFCFESTDRKLRSHSAARVIQEMRLLKEKFETEYFCFVDDIFTSDHRRVREICNLMIDTFKPNEDFFWYCEGRVDNLTKQPDLLPLMQRAGLNRLQIGTESGSQEVVDLYRKQIELPQAFEVASQACEVDLLSVYTNFIIGGAIETKSTFDDTLLMATQLMQAAPGRLEITSNFLSPYPGTDIYNNPERYKVRPLGRINSRPADEQFTTGLSDSYVFVETEALAKDQLFELRVVFVDVIKREMDQIARSMPVALIKRHLEMRRIGLSTFWSDFLLQDRILRSWFRFSGVSHYSCESPEFNSFNPRFTFPVRTIDLRQCIAGRFIWKLRGLRIDFSRQELFLVEQASGKNSLDEIVTRYVNEFSLATSPSSVLIDVQNFYGEMAGQLLLVY